MRNVHFNALKKMETEQSQGQIIETMHKASEEAMEILPDTVLMCKKNIPSNDGLDSLPYLQERSESQ